MILISGWWLTYPSGKYEFVNGVGIIPYNMENKKCSKPPTSYPLVNVYVTMERSTIFNG